MDYERVKLVHRKQKKFVKTLKILMLILTAFFLLMGIAFTRGFLMPCMLMAALYLVYEIVTVKDYQYTYEDGKLFIDVIFGGRYTKRKHELNLSEMVILAPHDDPSVAVYRKGNREGSLPKYDYTSYEEDIPFYTLIIMANSIKSKFLLDLDREWMDMLARKFPDKVVR